jgi:predicted nucleic acid-binding Zn ribbon protein
MDGIISSFSWSNHLDKAELFTNWENVVGKDSGEASTPEDLQAGVLSVKCRSTAWATQLRLLEKDILRRINTDFPNLEVVEIKFFGPNAPSWKKGSRSVPGRGPRDTYG